MGFTKILFKWWGEVNPKRGWKGQEGKDNIILFTLSVKPIKLVITNKIILIYSQDGGVGRHTLPPHASKRRTTTNFKTKSNQN